MMGGSAAHEFMYLNEVGENTLALCDACGYAANTEVAGFAKAAAAAEEPAPLERVATPGAATIAELAAFLEVPGSRTAKAVFLVGRFKAAEAGGESAERLVLAVIRGDLEVNEIKLANAAGALSLRPAHDEEIAAVGAVAGYASPMGLGESALVVADDSVTSSPNLVSGANEAGYHVRNVNHGRDWEAAVVADIALAEAGHACGACGAALRIVRGVEMGNIFQLGTRYSEALGASFLDEQGRERPVIMGSYGIGVGRLLACVAEEHHDDDGLSLPVTVAPYQVHLVSLARAEGPARSAAETLYEELRSAGVEVLYDDRAENPGVKFNDADLLGCPVRVTVGDRGLKKGTLEVKIRGGRGRGEEVPVAEVASRVREELAGLRRRIEESVGPVEYSD